jgi:hypothetical protein
MNMFIPALSGSASCGEYTTTVPVGSALAGAGAGSAGAAGAGSAGAAGAGAAGAGAGAEPPHAAKPKIITSESRTDENFANFLIYILLCFPAGLPALDMAYIPIIRDNGEKQQERKLTFL